MKVGMWATHEAEFMPLFLYTLKKGRVPYEISEGEKWVPGHAWEVRTRWYHKWCSQQGSEQVMLIDPFDHVLLGDIDLIQDRIDAIIGSDEILWSAERECWPNPERAHEFPQTTFGYNYPNGGAIVGPADGLAELFNPDTIPGFGNPNYYMKGIYHPDGNQPWVDQVFFQDLYLKGWGELDIYCELFQPLVNHRQDDFKRVGNRIENRNTASLPLFFHANGRARFPNCLMELLEETL